VISLTIIMLWTESSTALWIGTLGLGLSQASIFRTLIMRAGAELALVPELTVRAGVDRVDVKDDGNGVKPTFGFTARKAMGSWTPALTYAFLIEPFAPNGMHVISLAVLF
jgi:hypothetical protein